MRKITAPANWTVQNEMIRGYLENEEVISCQQHRIEYSRNKQNRDGRAPWRRQVRKDAFEAWVRSGLMMTVIDDSPGSRGGDIQLLQGCYSRSYFSEECRARFVRHGVWWLDAVIVGSFTSYTQAKTTLAKSGHVRESSVRCFLECGRTKIPTIRSRFIQR